jgi:hypothetical protein
MRITGIGIPKSQSSIGMSISMLSPTSPERSDCSTDWSSFLIRDDQIVVVDSCVAMCTLGNRRCGWL